jgi:hypothetical protein
MLAEYMGTQTDAIYQPQTDIEREYAVVAGTIAPVQEMIAPAMVAVIYAIPVRPEVAKMTWDSTE